MRKQKNSTIYWRFLNWRQKMILVFIWYTFACCALAFALGNA